MPRGYAQDRDTCISQRRVNKTIANSALEPPMRPVIQLNHSHYLEMRRITENEVNVLAGDAIEGRLPTAPTRSANGPHNVCQPDLGENLVIGCDCLLKYSEERTLCRCEQRGNCLVSTSNGVRCPLPTNQANQKCCDGKKHQRDDRNNQWRG